MVVLQKYPEQLALVCSNPFLLPNAIKELLRYAGRLMIIWHFAEEDIAVHGKNICKGEMVLFSLGTANLDPKQFFNPEVFDILREGKTIIFLRQRYSALFGCSACKIGSKSCLSYLLRCFPNLKLAIDPDELIYNHNKVVCFLASIPMIF
jgi:cytochrome P450